MECYNKKMKIGDYIFIKWVTSDSPHSISIVTDIKNFNYTAKVVYPIDECLFEAVVYPGFIIFHGSLNDTNFKILKNKKLVDVLYG